MKITAIIPARYQSSRFPGKPLIDIVGKPMIQHVYEKVSLAKMINQVIVATDDERIFRAVNAFGGEVVLTSPSHQTGTDRIAEVARNLDSDIIVNVQGDEPLVSPEMIERVTAPLAEDHSIVMGTLKKAIGHIRELFDPHVVKVVTDEEGYALYFSRLPIPFSRDAWGDIFGDGVSSQDLSLPERCYKHIGLYAYRRDFLLTFAALSSTPLERIEKLEQLRALEYGYRIKVVETDQETVGVDTPEDVEKVIAYLKHFKSA